MLRSLYRFYLYTVSIAMLLFAVFGMRQLIDILLAQSIFKDPSSTLDRPDLVQAIVFAVVSLVTAALFGGLHYWLIRRDMRNDSTAGSGGIRAFFLNLVELISLPLAVGNGAIAIAMLGRQNSYGLSAEFAFTITFLALWALLEWERQRSPASTGVALVFQRLHLYFAQLILLFILTATWLTTVGQLVDDIFFSGKGSGLPVCGGFTVCQDSNLLSGIAALLWATLFWLGYDFLTRKDTMSLLRKVFHFIGLGYGIIAIIGGIYRGVSLLLSPLFHRVLEPNSVSGPFAPYDAISPLTLGLLVVAAYLLWLRRAAQQQEQTSVSLTAHAIAATLLGASCWYGCGLLLLNVLETVSPSKTPVTPENWTTAIGLIVAGIAYIALDILLRRRSADAALMSPLRGFVFTLLGGGIVAGATGGATALYAYATFLLGSPLSNWQYTTHSGLAAFVVSVIVVGLYLRTSIRARFFGSSSKEQTLPIPAVVSPATKVSTATTVTLLPIAQIVDELLAGKITRDEAISQIEGLMTPH